MNPVSIDSIWTVCNKRKTFSFVITRIYKCLKLLVHLQRFTNLDSCQFNSLALWQVHNLSSMSSLNETLLVSHSYLNFFFRKKPSIHFGIIIWRLYLRHRLCNINDKYLYIFGTVYYLGIKIDVMLQAHINEIIV